MVSVRLSWPGKSFSIEIFRDAITVVPTLNAWEPIRETSFRASHQRMLVHRHFSSLCHWGLYLRSIWQSLQNFWRSQAVYDKRPPIRLMLQQIYACLVSRASKLASQRYQVCQWAISSYDWVSLDLLPQPEWTSRVYIVLGLRPTRTDLNHIRSHCMCFKVARKD